MRYVLFLLLVVFVGAVVALYAIDNPGYVLISRPPWTFETSLMVFIALLLTAFVVLQALLYIGFRLLRIPRDVARWRDRRHSRDARRALDQGLVKLAEGKWVEAEADLIASMRYSDVPLISYLGAACAAQAQNNIEKRDEYLAQAQKSAPDNALAVGMVQAYMQTFSRQSEQALATLTDLRNVAPRHRQVLSMLADTYVALRDWPDLAELMPELRASGGMEAKVVDALEKRLHSELLMLSLPAGSAEVLERAWKAVPRRLRHDPDLVRVYARQLIRQGAMDRAEAIVRETLNDSWNEALVELYGQASTADALEQLETAQQWLNDHGESASLLLTLGRICARIEPQRANARGYLERVIALHGPADAYFELAKLLESANEPEQALSMYRRGWEALTSAPPTPAVGARPRRTRLAAG